MADGDLTRTVEPQSERNASPDLYVDWPQFVAVSTRMDQFEIAIQRLAQATRTPRLIDFTLMQLRHTTSQLLAGLHDSLRVACPSRR
jgi:hypothetical protein